MPKMSTLKLEDRPQKILVFGGPKSGKTELVGQLAAHGYHLHWFDFENGADTLFKLPPEALENITLYSVGDTKNDPNAAKASAQFSDGKAFNICEEHGKVNCTNCKAKRLPVDSFDPAEIANDPKSVVVFDSVTQLVTSVQNHISRNEKWDDFGAINKESKREWGHYMAQNLILNAFFTAIQNARFKVVCISHEAELDPEKNPRAKIVQPIGGTSTQSKSVSKYFGHVVHCRLSNNKHSQISGTTSDNSTVAGSRTDIILSREETGLAAFFEKFKGSNVESVQEQKDETKVNSKVAEAKNKSSMSALEKLRNKG